MTLNSFGGRKFVLTVCCGAVTSLLTWFGKIDGGTYSVVILATVAVYIGGNVTQKVKT